MALMMVVGTLSLTVTTRPEAAAAAGPAWPTYHHDAGRSGVDPSVAVFTAVQAGWRSALDGAVYAEPLVAADGSVVVATENDSVYSLDAGSGAVNWQTHIGTPVPASSLPCGNIDPVGITSTPVLDTTSNVLYAVGFVGPGSNGQAGQFVLFALNAATGTVLWQRALAPTGFDPGPQGQRPALALASGTVYVEFGSREDCGTYHGYVLGVPASGSGATLVFETPPGSNGSFWAPSGPAVDSAGNLYVTTGNGSDTTYDYSDSVLKLSPTLALLDSYAPSDWSYLSSSDTDLGLVFQIGKEGVGYLLRQSQLSSSANHIGGEVYSSQVCPIGDGGAFGAVAYASPYLFVPCRSGIVALHVGAGSFSVA